MACLDDDLDSPEFLHGVNQRLWELKAREAQILFVWVLARGGRRYLLRLECTSYGTDAILGQFVDPETHRDQKGAWPMGTSAFEQWIKFNQPDGQRFICSDLDRQGLAHHGDWRARKAWERKPNQLVVYLRFISHLLRLPVNGYLPSMPLAS